MEVQIAPGPLFNDSNQNMFRASVQPQSYEPSSKRFKSDLTFQCIVCSDIYDDPNILYEHMKSKHKELYECEEGSSGEGFDSDSEHELSDEEYLDLSRLLEPICELKQDDDDDDDDGRMTKETAGLSTNIITQLMQNNVFGIPMNEEQLRLQIQLQMQLQSHLLQMQQMNGAGVALRKPEQKTSNRNSAGRPFALRELTMKYQGYKLIDL